MENYFNIMNSNLTVFKLGNLSISLRHNIQCWAVGISHGFPNCYTLLLGPIQIQVYYYTKSFFK